MVSERMNELQKRKQEASGLGDEKRKKTNLLLNHFRSHFFFPFIFRIHCTQVQRSGIHIKSVNGADPRYTMSSMSSMYILF